MARLLYNYKCVIPSGSKAHVHHVFYLQKQEELVVVTAYDILFGQVCHPFETLELIQFFEQLRMFTLSNHCKSSDIVAIKCLYFVLLIVLGI